MAETRTFIEGVGAYEPGATPAKVAAKEVSMKRRSWTAAIAIIAASCGGVRAGGGTSDTFTGHLEAAPPGEVVVLPERVMLHEGTASQVTELRTRLTGRAPVTFETTQLSPGSDPVLHLFDSSGTEVAVDDNGAGASAARLTYTPSSSGTFTLLVRSKSRSTAGTCAVTRNAAAWRVGVRFGGWDVILAGLRAKEVLETVRLPNGAGPRHAMLVLKSNGLGVEHWAEANGMAQGARITLLTTLGARRLVVAAPVRIDADTNILLSEANPGIFRLVRNDAALSGHDTDRDGLGHELEREAGTCTERTGLARGPDGVHFDCASAADARDTDGDGLSDGVELLGKEDPQFEQPLPLWGAHPRHKDMFVEVDFMRRTKEENDAGAALKMSDSTARKVKALYGDEMVSGELLKAYRAGELKNPDGRAGISVHFDTGRAPLSAADATTFGDWGGYNAVPAVLNSNGAWVGATAASSWQTNMHPVRRGLFRYVLAYGTGGGQQGEGFAVSYNFNDSFVAAHETGHSFGLGHSGVMKVYGDIDVNCMPNYASLMNYAFNNGDVGFADGFGARFLNNAALPETLGLDGFSVAHVDHLEQKFGYWVDRTNKFIDWNRDGVIAPAGTTVRAYANLRPGYSCEYTRYNQMAVSTAMTLKTPAMARLGDRQYIFYSRAGALKYVYAVSSWDCPTPAKSGCAGGGWTAERNVALASSGVDVSRIRVDRDGATIEQLLVVSVDGSGRLWERRLELSGSSEIWSSPRRLPGTAAGEPALTSADGEHIAYLMYKSASDQSVHMNTLDTRSGWRGDQVALDANGVGLPTPNDWASPTLVEAYLSHRPDSKEVYAFVPDAASVMDLYWLNRTTTRWEKVSSLFEGSRPGPIYGRPAAAWVATDSTAPSRGRLYLVWSRKPPSGTLRATLRMRMTYVKVATDPVTGAVLSKTEKLGLESDFDNAWLYGHGTDLLFETGKDTNLRAVFASAIRGQGNRLVFRPKADGINDFTYSNYNDLRVVRVNLCRYVVNPGGLVSSPIICPTKDW